MTDFRLALAALLLRQPGMKVEISQHELQKLYLNDEYELCIENDMFHRTYKVWLKRKEESVEAKVIKDNGIRLIGKDN